MIDTKDPYTLTASEALRQIDAGRLSPTDWVASCLERIRHREADIQAWVKVDDQILDEVKRRWEHDGRASIPIGVKDVIDVRGFPTMLGTDFHDPRPALRDGGSVAILREAGGAILGKTVTAELGHRHPGPTRNPVNTNHTPGGSSSGSAAAVGDKMVPVCLGTQTSGSVIRPAAYCGIVGYKPTYGDFDKSGILANAPSMDTLGLLARSVEDIGLMRGILLEEPFQGFAEIDFSRFRFGILKAPPWERADVEVQDSIEKFATQLSGLGAQIVEVQLDHEVSRLLELHRLISGYEFRRSIAFERLQHFDALSAILREGRLADGRELDNRGYQALILEVAEYQMRIAEKFQNVDILVTPSASSAAPKTLEATGDAAFNSAWTLTGNPVITLPLLESASTGMPIGYQLIGGFAADEFLLSAADLLMSHLGLPLR